ncbi:uncharacterized protein HGUI_02229 [Hanseniaspora guilliermondii]|uniref:BRO1 domain-containing protein n=1 Tax=Hanseniaspora guilliermondii TaxID=56406 RepID=A0A1L0CMD8_9ASCO|nr:uncharacterized protein HGUI_02229 [Hanseniaspora guilliermondii]
MSEDTNINLINPNVSFFPINLHFDHIKDIKPYERLSWFKIIKHYYQSNYGNALKLEDKSEIELLNNYYDVLTNNIDFPLESVVEYYYILNNLKERLPSDKSLDHSFMYDNKSLNMEMVYWLYQKFMLSYKQIQKSELDDKAKYSLTKECNAILQFILKNHEGMIQKKLKHLPNFYKEETLAFWIKIINALQQELFIKITVNNTKVTNYSLLFKMAYQVYVFYNDKVDVQNFLANRHNNYYETASDDNESDHHDDFTELSNMIKVKKSVWIITTCYYYCMHLYTKMKKYGEPLTLLKCFLNNYPFNENHDDIVNLKKQLITLHEMISKDNDFIYHEDVNIETKDYMSIIEGKIVPLNSNKYVLISDMLKKLDENESFTEEINKMFKNIINMKTLELESIYTAEKERFWHEQTEEILTSNLQLGSFIDYNRLNDIGNGNDQYANGTSLSDDDLQKMSQTIVSSDYSDIKAVKAKVVYLNEKAIELTKDATTPNQVALKDSLNNAVSNNAQLFQSINKYKHEIELMKNYQNLKTTHDHVKLNADMNNNAATMNLLDIEDPTESLERKIKENVEALKEIKVQRTSILKKFKHNESDNGSTIPNETSSILKMISKCKDKEKLRHEFIEFINECYSFETSTLIGLNKQQQLLVNQTSHLLHDLQSKINTQTTSTSNELVDFEQKLKDAYEAFKEFESNCRECLSYYNSLYELIPQHF